MIIDLRHKHVVVYHDHTVVPSIRIAESDVQAKLLIVHRFREFDLSYLKGFQGVRTCEFAGIAKMPFGENRAGQVLAIDHPFPAMVIHEHAGHTDLHLVQSFRVNRRYTRAAVAIISNTRRDVPYLATESLRLESLQPSDTISYTLPRRQNPSEYEFSISNRTAHQIFYR